MTAALFALLIDRASRLSRRSWLGWAFSGIAASGCRRTEERNAAPVDAGAPATSFVLGPVERRALAALCARILPSGDGAGAREADVITFIDRQLATHELAPLAPALSQCARLLDEQARSMHQRPFADLDPTFQDEMAEALSHGRLDAHGFPQSEAFNAIHSLTLEGFLSDPIHGGNRDQVGWRYVGFPEPSLRAPGQGPHHHAHAPATLDAAGAHHHLNVVH